MFEKEKKLNLRHALVVALAFLYVPTANAQTIDFAAEVVDYFADVKIEIVDYFADEKWEVVGACSNNPNVKIEIVDFFGDLKVDIVDYFADRKICIAGAQNLDEETLRLLHLID